VELILPEATPRHFKECLRLETNCIVFFSPKHLFNDSLQQSWADGIGRYDALAFEAAPELPQHVDPDMATITFQTLPFTPRPVPLLTASHVFLLNPWPSVPFTPINTASKRAYWLSETKPTLAESANDIAVLCHAATLFGENTFILVDNFKKTVNRFRPHPMEWWK
jgi:hypothetical protein